ncbi:helix-hairpin-helix domain-containing protein [Sinimarinibacterium sp. CAU 1509]|uniref:ComEA family DNA-binding protein n=1 Tax=Sinimarinibacterium sp. CAU 1509 TaxID=2562283 RepID=UPI0010AC362F|nr:helix-hairpin-helix domain-containing protein [Sinimarinibacterium sp. CAU 1509]TJY56787.1 helix-hairpin-helix domain-containing protein [Sinimarinibacterium sp. CAU 1509]
MNKSKMLFAALTSLISAAVFAGPVNINSADAKTLAKELSGIGPAKAKAIIEYREKVGPFKAPEEIVKVDGVGQALFEQNKNNIKVKD